MHVKKGDSVILIAGKDKDKKGKIIRVFPELGKVLVEGLNLVKRHQKQRKTGEKGQILDTARPLHASNVKKVE